MTPNPHSDDDSTRSEPDDPKEGLQPLEPCPPVTRSNSPRPPVTADHLRASLRSTEVYVRVLLDQIELAEATDSSAFDRVPTTAVRDLATINDTLHGRASRALHYIDRNIARNARIAAELAAYPHKP